MAQHPLLATGQRYFWTGLGIGAIGIGVSAAAGGAAGLVFGASALLYGGFFIWNGNALKMSGHALPIISATSALLVKGRFDEAERVPDLLPAGLNRRGWMQRVIGVQRALISLSRGDAATAEERATSSVEIPNGFWTAHSDETYRIEARAIRALARAAQGKSAEVEEDARAIETSPFALTAALARAQLARATVLARENDRAALREHMRKYGSLMLEQLLPRERSLTRALRSLASAPGKSVYREAARPDDQSEETRVRAWIESIAPDAAAFAPREAVAKELSVEAPKIDPEAAKAIAATRAANTPKQVNRARLTIALWAALVALFVVSYQFLTPATGRRPPAPEPDLTTFPTIAGCVALFLVGVYLFWAIRRQKSVQRQLVAADRSIALGRIEEGRAALLPVTTLKRYPTLIASARYRLATLANREGRFEDAITEADLGIGQCHRSPTYLALTRDLTHPALLGERALALAALSRFAEAETELAQLARDFPGYALLERVLFQVRLVMAVRRGDREGAAAIALSRRPELPLDLKIDLLADVALATDRERVAAERRAMPEVSAWIDRIAGARVAAEEPMQEEEHDDVIAVEASSVSSV